MQFFEKYKKYPKNWDTFSTVKVVFKFDKKWVGLCFGRFFLKLIWSYCLETIVFGRVFLVVVMTRADKERAGTLEEFLFDQIWTENWAKKMSHLSDRIRYILLSIFYPEICWTKKA
jgi:hypothetical protein